MADPLQHPAAVGEVILGEDTESEEEMDYDVIKPNNDEKIAKPKETSSSGSNFLSSLSSAFGMGSTTNQPDYDVRVGKLRQTNARAWSQKTRLEQNFTSNGMNNIRKFSRNYDINQQQTIKCSDNVRRTKFLVADTIQCVNDIVADSKEILRMKMNKS